MSSDVRPLTGVPMRTRLTAAAVQLVAAGEAAALSTRKVASAAGTSTMAVYTHFGSMAELARSVVEEGFARLETHLTSVEPTADPVHDLARQTAAYVAHARENPELYAVMFATAPLAGYRPATPEELHVGRRETLDRVAGTLDRAVAAGRLEPQPGSAPVFRWWTLVHGYVLLEGVGYLARERGPERVLGPLLVDFLVGQGDRRAEAERSIAGVLT